MLKHTHLKVILPTLLLWALGATLIALASEDLRSALPLQGAMIIGSIVIVLMQYIMTADLRRLTDRLEELSQGRMDGALLQEGVDDTGRIGRAINTLERRLKRAQRRVDALANRGIDEMLKSA